jgi:hypothetical protein
MQQPVSFMQNPRLIFVIAVALVVMNVASATAAQAAKKCRAADANSANLISQLTLMATATDSETVADRTSIYHLPVVSANQITIVTDEKVCTKVVQAVATLPAKRSPVDLYVVKLGSKGFAARDPTEMAGEYRTIFIFDSHYVKIGGWTGG